MIYSAYSEQKEEISGVKLVSCGHIFAKNGREINRPNGRKDWLLFYIVRESETFYLEEVKTGKAGSFILFAPDEKQHHIYLGSKTAEFYYIHFKCDKLPDNISLNSSKLYNLPVNRQVCDIFEDIISETLRKQPLYEKFCIYKFLFLLTLLEREILCDNHPERENFERIAAVIQNMNKFYNSNRRTCVFFYVITHYNNICSFFDVFIIMRQIFFNSNHICRNFKFIYKK